MADRRVITVHRPAPVLTGRLPRRPAPARHRAYMVTDTGVKWALPFAPVRASLGGFAQEWDTIERPGRKPINRRAGQQLATESYDLRIEYEDGRSVEADIDVITRAASWASSVTFTGMSKREAGPWRIAGLNVDLTRRGPRNEATAAVASFDLVQAYDVRVTATAVTLPAKKGPTTGGAVKPPTVPPKQQTRYHTVVKGDTLTGIAFRYYGHADRWVLIANANRTVIRNPRWITPGMRLLIPVAR